MTMMLNRPRWLAIVISVIVSGLTLAAQAPKATHVNRAIELLAQGQPIYYTGSHEGTDGSFEQGVKDAQTYADYISYDMEHAPFDVRGLADYMKGLAKGGPTKSGHRTPAVIVNVPVNGTDEATVRANAWMFQQVLATGVHGILLCHADTPGAVRAFVEAVRFPANGGRRGVHGNPTAARIWGISADEYAERADVWPLNPKGEILVVIMCEEVRAIKNLPKMLEQVPGIGVVLIGEGDLSQDLGFPRQYEHPTVAAAIGDILAICKQYNVPCGHPHVDSKNVEGLIKQGFRWLMPAPVRSFAPLEHGRRAAGRDS
jgi:4-hydroxy-2-oxoheptanedioate aldolase